MEIFSILHYSPLYDDDGYVVGTDSAGSLVSDLRSFLDECAKNNIDIYGSCPLCLAHSKCEDLIPYRMLRDKVKKYLESIKKNQPPDGCPCHPPLTSE